MQFAAENIVQLLFAFQGVFFGALTIGRKRLRPFAIILWTFAVHMVSNLMAETGNLDDSINFTSSFGFLYGPLFYLFVKELTSSSSTLGARSFFHAVPFVLSLFFPTESIVLLISIILSLLVYSVAIFRYMTSYRRALEHTVADGVTARANWLNRAAIAFALLAVYDGIRIVSNSAIPFLSEQAQYLGTLVAAFLIINWLIVKTLHYPDLFFGLSEAEKAAGKTDDASVAPLTENEKTTLQAALALFENKQLFLNPHFRLSGFAAATKIDSRILSRLIYRDSGKHFAAFVNARRIDFAKECIKIEGSASNFLKIAFEAGFNSKSAFNTAFKESVGLTPSAYRNQIISQS